MTLTIELSPELEQRLAERAAREGQDVSELARGALEQWLAETPAPPLSREELLAGIPLRTPANLLDLARAQGVEPLPPLETYLGGVWPEDEDVEEFINMRRAWQVDPLVKLQEVFEPETPQS